MSKTTISIQQTTNQKLQETKKKLNQMDVKIPSANDLVGFALYKLNQEVNPTNSENLKEELREFKHLKIEEE